MAKITKGKVFFNILKGLITRLIFLLHGTLSLYLLYRSNDFTKIYILFALPMVALLAEGLFIFWYRKGKEFKYFWPSGFLYIATIVPMVWLLELNLLQARQSPQAQNVGTTTNATNGTIQQTNKYGEMLLEALSASDLDARKFSEIGIMICLIAGRWLAPRAFLSRNQLSALLLGYVSNAADILELFESLQSPTSTIVLHRGVTYGILVVYTWAILQFTLVTTATPDWRKPVVNDPSGNDLEANSERETILDTRTDESGRNSRYGTINSLPPEQDEGEVKKCVNWCKFHPEHFQIFATLLMQDGPFLILRLVMSIKFDFVTELHIFFMCKNAVVCVLLVHRLLVLAFDDDAIDEDEEIGIDNPVPVEDDDQELVHSNEEK